MTDGRDPVRKLPGLSHVSKCIQGHVIAVKPLPMQMRMDMSGDVAISPSLLRASWMRCDVWWSMHSLTNGGW